jgi:hypothetical protein
MMAMPMRAWQRLVRRLSQGDNPLRRRADVVEGWLAPIAILLFLALCPVVFVLSSMWVTAGNTAVRQAQQSWLPVPAVLLHAAPGPEFPDGGANTWQAWALGRWTVYGRQHVGDIPVAADSRAGSTQTVWLNTAGRVMVPPETAGQARDEATVMALIAMAAIALLLGISTRLARWSLDRRRLAGWETAWLSVGPRWSHQL